MNSQLLTHQSQIGQLQDNPLQKSQNIRYVKHQHDYKSVAEANQKLKMIKDEISKTKISLQEKRKQLKGISQKVQQQLQKAIQKIPASKNKNISSYFSKEQQEVGTQKKRQLKSQLVKTMNQIDRIKKQLIKMQQSKMNKFNNEKSNELQNILSSRTQQLKTLKLTKQTLERQIQLLQESIDDLNLPESNQIMKNHLSTQNDINKQIKSERIKLTTLERQDRFVTQKIKYLHEMIELNSNRKTITREQHQKKSQNGTEIAELNQQIKNLLFQKYKVETEIKIQLDALKQKKEKLDHENSQINNKLRQHDLFLVNYYNTIKFQKKKRESSLANQSVMTRKQQSITQMQTLQSPQIRYENFQKQNSVDFRMVQTQETMIIRDHFDQKKTLVEKITIYFDSKNILGLSIDYVSSFGKEQGNKMVSVPNMNDLKSQSLKIQNDDYIQTIQIGCNSNDSNITFFKITSKQSKTLAWGNQQSPIKKKLIILEYISLTLSCCLKQDQNAKKGYVLYGIRFNFITLEKTMEKRNKNYISRKVKNIGH